MKIIVAQSCPTLCDPMNCIAHQAPLSIEFSRQEYRSGWPCPPPGDLPNPGIEPGSPALQADSFQSEPPGKPWSILEYNQLINNVRVSSAQQSKPRHTYTCIHSLPNSFPILAATQHWTEFSVLYSRSLLVIHFKYSSVVHVLLSISWPTQEASPMVRNEFLKVK